jgi:uncharacterized damage-inducible protein DinB
MKSFFLFTAMAAALAMPSPASAGTFDDECHAAMAPYYAALLTSARADVDGTLRHLVVLKSRWTRVQAVPASERPAWAAEAPGTLPDVVASRIEAARTAAVARDSVAAHAALESIRALLRDARARAGVRTFDDAVTDYHEAMERLTGRAGLHNEIALNADDYSAIEGHVARANAMWAEITRSAGAVKASAAWPRISGSTESVLAKLRTASSAKDMAATQLASEELKARYFDLVAVLARG